MRRALVAAAFLLALLGLWQMAALSGRWSPVLLPPPTMVGHYLLDAWRDGSLVEAIEVTLRRLLVGYAIGVAIGLPLGLLTSTSDFFEDTIGALALGLQTLPSVCWVPLALLWFGQTETAMLFVVVMGTVWSVVLATDAGARTIPPIYAGRAHDGVGGFRQMDAGYPARIVAVRGQRHETRLGICLAFAYGGGDICHHSYRVWSWPFAAIRPRTERDGSGHRRDGRDRRDWLDCGQDPLLAVGKIPASPLGNGIEIRPTEKGSRLGVGAPTVRRSIMGPRIPGRLHVASGREMRWYARDAERRSVRVGRPARS